MKALRSKLLSLFAAVVLVTGLVPSFAFAEITSDGTDVSSFASEGTSEVNVDDGMAAVTSIAGEYDPAGIMPLASSPTKESTSAASVQTDSGTLYYDNIQEAWEAAVATDSAATITFTAPLTVSSSFEIPSGSNADITFKFSGTGVQLTSTSSDPLFVVNSGNLYINQGTYNCDQLIQVNGGSASIGGIGTGSKAQGVAVSNGTLELMGSNALTFGSATVTGGSLVITKTKEIGVLTATGGTITQSTGIISSGSIDADATLSSTGGTINNLQVNGGTVNLSGITASGVEISDGDVTFSGTTLNSSTLIGGTLDLAGGTVNDFVRSGGTLNVGEAVFTSVDRDFLETLGLSAEEIETYYIGTNESGSPYAFAKSASGLAGALGIGAGSMLTLLYVPTSSGDISIDPGIFVENGTTSSITVNGQTIEPEGNNSPIQIYVNDVLYYTLGSALNAASNGDIVKLGTDVPLSSPVTISSSITLDLNGHAINGSTTSNPMININGEEIVVTITDISGENGSINCAKSARAITVTQGALTFESGTITNSYSSGTGIYVSSGAEFTMTGGTISSTQTGLNVGSGGTASIMNGTISAAPSSAGSATVYCGINGKLIIEDGVFIDRSSAKTKYVLYAASSAQAVINGGTFTGKIYGSKPVLTVYGGSFTSTSISANWIADGYVSEDEGNGYSKIVLGDESSFVAEVNGVKYGQLSQAISVAKSGDTIALLQDATVSNTISIATKSITIDLNGNSIIPSSATVTPLFDVYCTPMITGGVSVTFTGSGTVGSADTDMAIRMRASNPAVTVNIEPDVTVMADTAIFIQPFGTNSDSSSAVANLNVEGTVTSPATQGSGINVHGQLIKGVANITLGSTANVSGPLGIYQAGNGNTVINGATIEGATGIEVRSGKLTVNDGTILSNASSISTNPNGSGATTIGAAIAVSQHTTERPIKITVIDGKISGFVGLSIADPQANGKSDDIDITISGGDFIATGNSPDSRSVSVESGYDVSGFVEGGNFSDSLMDTGYLDPELTAQLWSTQKNEDAPFSYYPTMSDALGAAEDGDYVTSVTTTEDTDRTVPIVFRSGYDNVNISVQYPDDGEMTVPDNQYFEHPDGLQFQGWLVGDIPKTDPGVVDSDVPSAADEDAGVQALAGSAVGRIVKPGESIELPSEGLLLTAQWGTPTADEVDTSALEAAIEEANGKVASEYSPDSWETFADALTAAKDVLANPDASQDEVDEATSLLTAAMAALEPTGEGGSGETTVDKSALEAAMAAAKDKNESLYTPESWKALQDALAAAQAVFNDPDATQDEVDAATALINSAMDALVKRDATKTPADAAGDDSSSDSTSKDGGMSDTGDPMTDLVSLFSIIALASGAAMTSRVLRRRYLA